MIRLVLFYLISAAILLTLGWVGFSADAESFTGSLFAAFLSVFLVVFVELELRPRIHSTPEPRPPASRRAQIPACFSGKPAFMVAA